MPDATDAFDFTTLDATDYYSYYNAVLNQQSVGKEQPYRYGAYQIY